MPTDVRPKPRKFEAVSTSSDILLRVNPEAQPKLLAIESYQKFSTEELMDWARFRLGLARLGPIRGIRVTDRVMAIAVLEGLPDLTEYQESAADESPSAEPAQ
jgi:hypothetical protein